jgi:hypothetical protein
MAGVERVIRVFNSHAEADAADRAYYRSLTPQQRLDILLEMLAWGRTGDATGERLERVYRIVELERG